MTGGCNVVDEYYEDERKDSQRERLTINFMVRFGIGSHLLDELDIADERESGSAIWIGR